MPSTLPTPDELRQHPVVQVLTDAHAQLTKQSDTPKQTRWLACSGGRDSLGLAYACHLAQIDVRLIHINHQLQPQAADWQQRVEDYAHRWSMPFDSYVVNLKNKTEVAARQARFDAIFSQMQHNDILLLGHHADDQAETVLMNLCKGAGLNGLSGMAEWSSRTYEEKRLNLWRPWLSVTRAQITDFVEQAQLDFVDDPTNLDSASLDSASIANSSLAKKPTVNARAFLRSHVFPQLESRWGNTIQNIGRAANIIAEAETILKAQTQTDILTVCDSMGNIHTDALCQLPIERQYRTLASWIQGNDVYAPPREQVELVHALAISNNTEQQTQLHWHNIQVRRFKNHLYRLPKQIDKAVTQDITLYEHSRIALPSGHWQVVKTTEDTQGLPLHLLGKPLRLRPRQLGERLHIVGRVGSWPLKKFFQSQQVAPWQRDQAHILQIANFDIALVCHAGFFLLQPKTQHAAAFPSNSKTVTQQGWILQPSNKPVNI